MQKIKDTLEILFWKIAKYFIVKGYGCDCKTTDLEDHPEMYTKPEHVFASSRCGSCRAKEMCDWIDNHIDLISY